jgi:hypothetical protein
MSNRIQAAPGLPPSYCLPGLFTLGNDRDASPPERGNGSLPWSGLQAEFLERTPGKNASAEASAKAGIEAVRLRASLLQAHLSIDRVSSGLL